MICPKCGHDSASEIAARFDITQNVKDNSGKIIGIQTGTIQGDVYGGDIYHVQVYVASDIGGEPKRRGPIIDNPYKFLSPYTAQDWVLFKGRDVEIEQVVRRIGEQRVLVIYGQAGVGVTSLLAAGVIPKLVQYGALVVHLHEYTQPLEKVIREALIASADQILVKLPDNQTLPELVGTLLEATERKRSLVLVLDQFERLFEPAVDGDHQKATIEGLLETLQAVDPLFLRLIIAVQEDALKHLGELQDRLPDLLRSPLKLSPLGHRQAEIAIKDPLKELGYPVTYVGNLVDERLVPDLDDLTPETQGYIYPPHLQIVCHWLYQAARDRDPPQIDTALYNEAKNAEGIMARYLEETLHTQLADQQALAERVLAAMASPDVGRWVSPEQLPANGTPPEQVRDVLKRLVEAKLLASRPANGRREFTFAGRNVAQEVRRLAGPEVEHRYQAESELESIWRAWLARDALATRGQLRYLAKDGAYLTPGAVKVLFLLRSAVTRDEPAGPWLARLRGDEGRALIRQLEEPDARDLSQHSGRSTLNNAALLLGLPDVTQPDLSEEGRKPFGPVARSAVNHSEPAIRQTAALALTAIGSHEALNRLSWALPAGPQGWRRRERQAELRGALANADPEIEKLNSDLPLLDRMWIWWWQFRRRIVRDRQSIAGLALGGAIGAGLGLGLLRMVIAGLLAEFLWQTQFAMYFWWAWILGAALALGMVLGERLLLGQTEETGEIPAIWQAPLHPNRLPALLAASLGTLFFGIAHMIVAWFNGASLTWEALVLGLLAGLGLSVALYAQPRAGWHLGIVRWLPRLGAAALAVFLTQLIFVVAESRQAGLAIIWAFGKYHGALRDQVKAWPQWVEWFPRWPDYLALIDAALVGIVLAIGITAGLLLSQEWLKKWRDLANRAGD